MRNSVTFITRGVVLTIHNPYVPHSSGLFGFSKFIQQKNGYPVMGNHTISQKAIVNLRILFHFFNELNYE